MIRKIALGILVVVVIAVTAVYFSYSEWRQNRSETLRSGSRIAETSFGPIEYVVKGTHGPVLLFLHGSPGGYDQAPADREGFRVLAPSRPGYLLTPMEVGPTPAEQARAYAALLDSLGIDAVIVMGVSGGGPSAISFAAMYPERTRALIAIETISQPYRKEENPPLLLRSDFLYWMILSAALQIRGPEGIVIDQVPDASNQQRMLGDPRKLKEFSRLLWSIGPPSLRIAGWRNDMAQVKSLALPTKNIRAPTLILHGTADALVPFAQSQLLAQQIPGARFHVINGADHMMPISHEEEINTVIDEFLRGLAE